MVARLLTILAVLVALGAPAFAQSAQEVAQMRLYIQDLEERVRQLTGEVERLQFELRQARAGAVSGGAAEPGAVATAPLTPPDAAGAPPQDLGTLSVAEDDPLVAPDGSLTDDDVAAVLEAPPGDAAGEPLDLSALAGGTAEAPAVQEPAVGGEAPAAVASPQETTRTAALSGSPRDEYDLAYGYVLTGDYGLAEEHFRAWLEAFPDSGQAEDARFWLAESQLQQGKHRDAANAFLDLYKRAPKGRKAPDTLMRLGVALAALGERDAACATLSEVSRRHPDASSAVQGRVASERQRVGC